MSVVAFDTHKFVKRLREAGFNEAQAEAVTSAVQEAASIDLSALATKTEISAGLKETELRLEARVESVKVDIMKWLVPLMLGQAAVIAALVKLL